MGNRIYGCDDCLAVCPWNKFAQAGREAKLAARESLRAPRLAELARLDDASFRALFTKSPVKRTGRDRFIRNVLIAIGNSGDAALAADAERLLDDASPLVRGAAVWALARLDPARLAAHARQRATAKTDPAVREEWTARSQARRPECRRCSASASAIARAIYVAEFGARFDRIIGTSRTPKPAGRGRDAGVRRRIAFGRGARRRRGGDASAALADARRSRRSDRCVALGSDIAARAEARIDRLSLVARRLWRPRRRLGRRDRDDHPGACARRRAASRRAGLAGARRSSAAFRSRCCGSPASTDRGRTCSRGCWPAAPTASPSRDTCSTASTSPTSRRRSTPPSRARPTASSTSPTTSPRPIPTRC